MLISPGRKDLAQTYRRSWTFPLASSGAAPTVLPSRQLVLPWRFKPNIPSAGEVAIWIFHSLCTFSSPCNYHSPNTIKKIISSLQISSYRSLSCPLPKHRRRRQVTLKLSIPLVHSLCTSFLLDWRATNSAWLMDCETSLYHQLRVYSSKPFGLSPVLGVYQPRRLHGWSMSARPYIKPEHSELWSKVTWLCFKESKNRHLQKTELSRQLAKSQCFVLPTFEHCHM